MHAATDGPRPWRIGLTGSAGVGKTTLALTLGATLDLPVWQEAMRARLEAGFSLAGLSRQEHQQLLQADAADVARFVDQTTGGCVIDRTPLDFLAFWFCNGYGADSPAETAGFVASAVAAANRLDLVAVLPWGALPLEDDGVRYPNPWHQLHAQTMIEGLCRRYLPEQKLVFIPDNINQPEDRCRWILRRIGEI